jgi:hypothetical protein
LGWRGEWTGDETKVEIKASKSGITIISTGAYEVQNSITYITIMGLDNSPKKENGVSGVVWMEDVGVARISGLGITLKGGEVVVDLE